MLGAGGAGGVRDGVLSDRQRTKDVLLWMLSTKMLPAVGVLVPIYLIERATRGCSIPCLRPDHHLHAFGPADCGVDAVHLFQRNAQGDHRGGAASTGAASVRQVVTNVVLPLGRAGDRIDGGCSTSSSVGTRRSGASTSRRTTAAPLPAFIASFSAPQGLFWAKLSAASVLAIAPILVFGWVSQRQLVRGLTFGAVK